MAKKPTLKQKPATPVLDPAAIARADAIVAQLSERYVEMVSPELVRFVACWESIQHAAAADANGSSSDEHEKLYRMAHDFKGHAGSYGYPLVSTIAAAVCRMIKEDALSTSAGRATIDRHVEAVRCIISERLSGDGGKRGAEIMAGL